ncbi:hypothetical protein FRC09_013756 [Ceratobasidium sp. 395]|nr:hypothetical protein FRC09_013756 [Ceratobasidium sp. 395]
MSHKSLDERLRRRLTRNHMDEVLSEPLLQSLYSDDPIDKILTKKDVTATTFQNLIRLLLVPTQLSLLEGTKIIPTLMSLLRKHCQRSTPYDSEYGFYCVEAIIFALGIGVLADSKFLKQYVDQAGKLPAPRNAHDNYVTLGDCVAQFIPKGPDSATEWDRKQMLWAHTIAGTSPGWWYVLFLLWLFNQYTLPDRTLMDRIYAIALRIEVNSSWDKHDLLERLILMIGTNLQQTESTQASVRAVDPEDASIILSGYYQYITTYDKRNAEVLGLVIMWAGDTVCGRNDLDMRLEYLKSYLDVLWEGVVREDDALDRMVDGTTEATEQASLGFLAGHFLKLTKGCTRQVTARFPHQGLNFFGVEVAADQAMEFNVALMELASSVKPTHKKTYRPVPYILEATMDWLKLAYHFEDAVKICSATTMNAITICTLLKRRGGPCGT